MSTVRYSISQSTLEKVIAILAELPLKHSIDVYNEIQSDAKPIEVETQEDES